MPKLWSDASWIGGLDDPVRWIPLLERQAITLDISLPNEEFTVYYKL